MMAGFGSSLVHGLDEPMAVLGQRPLLTLLCDHVSTQHCCLVTPFSMHAAKQSKQSNVRHSSLLPCFTSQQG